MFSIAPHFYPTCFGNVVLLSPIYLGQRGGTLYFKIGTSSLVASIVSFPFEWWANQIGWLQKNTDWTWEAPRLVDRRGELETFNGRGCSLCIIGAGFDSHKIDETCFQFYLFFGFALLRINYHQASVKDIVIVETVEIYLNQHDKQRKDGTMRSLFVYFCFPWLELILTKHQSKV
jgi:hypothetical protein